MNHDQRARAMTDAQLSSEELRLKRETAQAQSLLAAVRRERKHRRRKARKEAS